MSTQTPTSTHQAVQAYYGKAVREAEAESCSCCGTNPQTTQIHNELYPPELLAGLPPDIANFTAGSGDPITLAQLKPGERVLDLGSGAGLDCFLAARQVGPGGRVIGVDMTSEMLARAHANAARVYFPNVEFREGFLEALPVDDASIDAVISNCVINLSPDKPQVFREIWRVLKPGGRMAVSDMVANRPVAQEARENPEQWCGCTSGALARRDYIQQLAEAGFVEIQFEPNIEMVVKAIESGRVRSPQNRSKEEILDGLLHFDDLPGLAIVPHKITARKPVS